MPRMTLTVMLRFRQLPTNAWGSPGDSLPEYLSPSARRGGGTEFLIKPQNNYTRYRPSELPAEMVWKNIRKPKPTSFRRG